MAHKLQPLQLFKLRKEAKQLIVLLFVVEETQPGEEVGTHLLIARFAAKGDTQQRTTGIEPICNTPLLNTSSPKPCKPLLIFPLNLNGYWIQVPPRTSLMIPINSPPSLHILG